MLTLLGKTSSINVRKVLWTCEELGLQYQQQDYGSGFASTETSEFKALNPNAMVPVLRDGDFVLWESNSICRYLANKHSQAGLLPPAPQPRALVEKWMDWQATELNNAWRYAFMALVRQSPKHRDAAAIATSVQEWNRHVQMLEQQLERTHNYMAGPEFTLADVVIGLSLNRWLLTPMERPSLPAVAAYFARLSERPAFRRHGCNGIA